ncbi:hypothetical protein QLQ12_10220 [Actinoplanes sp. NEAU-A12]|uniref:ANTAR domain-containing protein n=1 Tax=Actinoplanes sandaracinus TaxID=3045177 RepID=A0ABT6WGZ7_9ACTN|nr:hypothetical protein [Actinoplanes sandaracinus]MDI6098975.1 hypothetical protein [Actinoplanes sandaracinus]
MTSLSAQTPTSTGHPLAEAIVALAETPDDMPGIDARLQRVAQLAADRIAVVDYAAVAPRPGDGSCIVAASGELIDAVEEVSTAAPPAAMGPGTTMTWPHFRETAAGLGMRVVSVPLFTGGGAAIATLDLYSRDPDAMAALTAGVRAAHDPELPWPGDEGDMRALDAGAEELLTGYAEALSVRATIQLALAMLGRSMPGGPKDAYLRLRLHAAGEGVSLLRAATTVIEADLA